MAEEMRGMGVMIRPRINYVSRLHVWLVWCQGHFVFQFSPKKGITLMHVSAQGRRLLSSHDVRLSFPYFVSCG
jgi:hypothetical protein